MDLSSFRRVWVTPEQARLGWVLPDPSAASELQVDLAPSTAAMMAGAFETIDGADNPELGRPFLLRTGGADPVLGTVLRELDPDSGYAARLVVIDRGGGVSCSGIVPFRTNLAATDGIPVFEDSLPPGASLHRTCTELVSDAAAAEDGEVSIAHTFACARVGTSSSSVCGAPATISPDCWENVGFQNGSVDVGTLSAGDLTTAYVEVAVAVDDVSTAFWSEAALQVGTAFYRAETFTLITDGAYHRYQFPLAALGRACFDREPDCVWDEKIEGLEQLADGIGGFRVGTTLSHGARLSLDSVWLRW